MTTPRPSPFTVLPASFLALLAPPLAAISIACSAAAQTTVPIQIPARPSAPSSASLPPPVTESERHFRDLSDYIRARGELDAATRTELDRVARELDADIAKPGERIPTLVRLLAARAQTSIWLDDRAARDSAFERLSAFSANKDPVLLAWTRELIACADFERALEVMQGHAFGPDRAVEARILLATCLVANNRYDEAQAALNSAPMQRSQDQLTRIGNLTGVITKLRDLWNAEMVAMAADQRRGDLPVVEFVTPKGAITIELFEDQAPNTVGNFIEHVEAGTYNGTRFHRVLRGFGVQGGDPATATGGVGGKSTGGWTIPDETSSEAKRAPLLGRLLVASQPDPTTTVPKPHSGGCQFMILLTHGEDLQGQHTVFGRVTDGLDIARTLTQDDQIVTARVIRKRNHDYKGVRFSEDAQGDFSLPRGVAAATRVLETKIEKPAMPSGAGAPMAAPGGSQPRLQPVQPSSAPRGAPQQVPLTPTPPPLLTPNSPQPAPK